MPDIFTFKQFRVEQEGCAMKVNTDGVLLGALASADQPRTILDIGSGTGVIALMLAQRYPEASVHGAEIDESAAKVAAGNFANSPFRDRMNCIHSAFQELEPAVYDLIVSNPPYFIDSLKSGAANKQLARHTGHSFFADLAVTADNFLSEKGRIWLILPAEAFSLMKDLAEERGLKLIRHLRISSFPDSKTIRHVASFGRSGEKTESGAAIYEKPKEYSVWYRSLLSEFLIIF